MYDDNKKKYTVKDYNALPEGSPYQLINGDLVAMTPSPTFYHQSILLKLTLELSRYLEKNNIGKIAFSPLDVMLSDNDVFQPDLVFISNERQQIIKERIEGVPDLVIEIISESTAYYDLRIKKSVYESSGVLEYWIVDPIAKSIEVYESDGGSFRIFSKSDIKGFVISKILAGLEVHVDNIF